MKTYNAVQQTIAKWREMTGNLTDHAEELRIEGLHEGLPAMTDEPDQAAIDSMTTEQLIEYMRGQRQ